MTQDEERRRTVEAKIERLRVRIRRLSDLDETILDVRSILNGILDLLADEL